MIKLRNRMSKLSLVVCVLFSFAQVPCDVICAAEDPAAGGPAKEWSDKAHNASIAGNYDEAILLADKAIEIDPDYADAYYTRGYANWQKKLFEKAIEDFSMVIELQPGSPEAYINRGSIKSSMGLYDGCIEDQSAAIKLAMEQNAAASLMATAYYRRGRAYFRKGENDAAVRDLSRYIELKPEREAVDGYQARAAAYEAKGQIAEATDDLNKALTLDPGNEDCKQQLAKLEKSAVLAGKGGGPGREWTDKARRANADGKWDDAISYANMAIKADPNDPKAYFERGRARYEKDILKEGVEDLDKAIKLEPDYIAAYEYRGYTKADMGLLKENIEDQDMTVKLSPNDPVCYSNRGTAYHRNKQYDLALADYERSLEMSPDDPDTYRRRGNAYYRKGDYNRALWDYDMANRLNPNDDDIYFLRSRVYFKKGNYDAAIADCNRTIEIYPRKAGAYNVRADAYRAKGEHGQAIKDYNKSIELNPEQKDLNSYFGRAMAYKAVGQDKEALEDLKTAAALDPKNKELQEELAKTEKGPAAGSPSYAAPAAQVSTEGARVLTPFTGYALDDPCEKSNAPLPGVPWGPGTPPNDAAVASSELGQYEALLRHTMQVLRLLYGNMSDQENKSFDAFWAPFYDHPTKAGLEYFKTITPLLDDLVVSVNNIDGMIAGFGVGLQEVLLADSVEGAAGGVAAAGYQALKSERAKLDDVVKKINALGNPPNPLAAKCAAKTRHKKALGGIDVWELLKKSTFVGLRAGENTVAGNISYVDDIDKPSGDLRWNGTKFTYSSKYPHFDDPAAPWCYGNEGQPQWGGFTYMFEGGGEMSKDGMTVISYHGVLTRRNVESPGFPGQRVAEVVKNFNYENLKLVLYKGAPVEAGDRIRLVYSNVDNPDLTGQNFVEGSLVLEFRNVLDKVEIDWAAVVKEVGNAVKRAGGEETSASSVVTNKIVPGQPVGGVQQGGAGWQASADPEKDPQVIKEAIDQHLALAAQARSNADRWAKDARSENDPKRRKELETRAAEIYANAQTEMDIAESLRTGTMVHTRTEWDERQHLALVNSIKEEIAIFDAENKILANIPKVGNMVEGREGVDLREETQKKITEAIKSPDRLQKLQAIYGGLQDKVVQQGEKQMADEEAKIEMWESRISAAENVKSAASTAFLLATLWNPAEIGSLALGFAGATGFAEGGVKGAAIAITRGVSARADVLISAYEGATRIDPKTKQPLGAWGALEGAVWAIGTNAAFATLGTRLQKAKADYALSRQAMGGKGFKEVARAKGPGKIKEYDFKTPEQRYKAELAAAKTPGQKAEVNKKYDIQVKRENMNREREAAKKKAEDSIRKGGDKEKAREEYDKDLETINKKYKDTTRNEEHLDVMDKLGLNAKEPTEAEKAQGIDNRDLKPAGGKPETVASDVDLIPQGTPHEAYQKGRKYSEEMQKRGHDVVEYGDRWVDNTTDTTIWKPGFDGDRPGSGSFEAGAIFGTLPQSDKFGTKGGTDMVNVKKGGVVEDSKTVLDDPLGGILANAGKSSGAGLGNSRPKDLHTIGKSASKCLDILKATGSKDVDVDPQLRSQIEALRNHKTPE